MRLWILAALGVLLATLVVADQKYHLDSSLQGLDDDIYRTMSEDVELERRTRSISAGGWFKQVYNTVRRSVMPILPKMKAMPRRPGPGRRKPPPRIPPPKPRGPSLPRKQPKTPSKKKV